MPYINICGKQIYFEEYGKENGAALVYLHGGPGESCLTYTYQAKQLGTHCRVISFDQYGVFRSDALPEDCKLCVNDLVEMTEQMRIALGIKSWIPLGHSFGGDACAHLCPHIPRQRRCCHLRQPHVERSAYCEGDRKCHSAVL